MTLNYADNCLIHVTVHCWLSEFLALLKPVGNTLSLAHFIITNNEMRLSM